MRKIKSIVHKMAFVVGTISLVSVLAFVGLFNLGGGYSDSLNVLYDYLNGCALAVGGTIKYAIVADADDLDCWDYWDHIVNDIWEQKGEA